MPYSLRKALRILLLLKILTPDINKVKNEKCAGDPVDLGQRQHDQLAGAGQLQLGVLLLREAREGARHPGFSLQS